MTTISALFRVSRLARKSTLQICRGIEKQRVLKPITPNYKIVLRHFSISTSFLKYAKFIGPHEAVLSVQGAKDFIFRLTVEERHVLLGELQAFQEAAIKASGKTEPPPSSEQLRAVIYHNALPFIGFGFLDNFIMIVAGDYIDTKIGVALGISTLAAAGLGNTLSDIAGIGSAWYIENIATRIGVNPPNLTPAQVDMTRTRFSANMGRAIGITIGCILGMCPLIFMKRKTDDSKRDSR